MSAQNQILKDLEREVQSLSQTVQQLIAFANGATAQIQAMQQILATTWGIVETLADKADVEIPKPPTNGPGL